MTWYSLLDFDRNIAHMDSSNPVYCQQLTSHLNNIVDFNELTKKEIVELASAIINRDRHNSKIIENKWLSELDDIAEKTGCGSHAEFLKIYYECLHSGSTEKVLDYIKTRSPKLNYHDDLCRTCNKNKTPKIKNESATEVCKDSLNALLCIYSLNSYNKKHRFMFVNCKSAFLPSTESSATCSISTMSPQDIYHKIKYILIEKLDFTTVENDPSLLYHDIYGYALVYRWQVLLFSKCPAYVRDMLSEELEITASQYKNFNFMGFNFKIMKHCVYIEAHGYISKKINQLFAYKQKLYVTNGSKRPTQDCFSELIHPPHDNPDGITPEHISVHKTWRAFLVPHDFPRTNVSYSWVQSAMAVLNHIAKYYRFDLKFYAKILNRYMHNPNEMFLVSLLNIFRYIHTTRYTETTYSILPKETPISVKIYVSGSYSSDNPKSSYMGYIITIADQYWHSDCQLIPFAVDDSYSSAICAAFEASEYIDKHMNILNTLSESSSRHLEFLLVTDNDSLFRTFADHDFSHSIVKHIRQRRNRAFNILASLNTKLRKLTRKELNPASILTSDKESTMDNTFYNTGISDTLAYNLDL